MRMRMTEQVNWYTGIAVELTGCVTEGNNPYVEGRLSCSGIMEWFKADEIKTIEYDESLKGVRHLYVSDDCREAYTTTGQTFKAYNGQMYYGVENAPGSREHVRNFAPARRLLKIIQK